MNDAISRRAALEKVRAMQTYKLFTGDDMILVDKAEVQTELVMLPTIQPRSTAGQLNAGAQSTNLIDRQETIDRFNVIRPVDPKKDEYTKGIDVGIAMCIVAVKDQPTIQPEVLACGSGELVVQPEPQEGEWEQVSAQRYFMSASYFYRCSACGVNNVRNTNYCPNCGAKMRGEQHETD